MSKVPCWCGEHPFAAEVDETGALFLGAHTDPHPDGVFAAVCARSGCRIRRRSTWLAGELIAVYVSDLAVTGGF